MKFIRTLIAFLLISVLLTSIGVFLIFKNIEDIKKTGKNLVLDIINNKPENFEANYSSWNKQINLFKPFLKLFSYDFILEFNEQIPFLVAKDGSKTYFVLFQNNFELRPSGGFIGSYGRLKFSDGGMSDFTVQDIYVPDGQIGGHVEPPWPIQQAFEQGWWRLRDSNWHTNYPTAAKQITWFFKKGGEEEADGIMALNLLVIEDVLKIFEPIKLADYDVEITPENLYQYAQTEAEEEFFPGSTQKKDFLSSLTKNLIFKIENINNEQLLQLIKVIKNNLDEKQILININNSQLQEITRDLNWDGAVVRNIKDTDNQISDYLYIIDTNLGANKANCCVERKANQEIEIDQEGFLTERLEITYINKSPKERPMPPLFYGGVYENFLRVILPIETENIEIKVDNKAFKDRLEITDDEKRQLKTIGFFVITQPLSQSKVEISFKKPVDIKNKKTYILEIQKQPGIESYPHSINIKTFEKDNNIEKNIKKDEIIKISI